jgi:3-isopropylmalate/(R)-2-methylmalate dehydratase small subunit
MTQFTRLTSPVAPLLVDNIDTDQIIPARFLKITHRSGLGERLFADWRYTADGMPCPDFVLNDPLYSGAQILFAGDNFGCGSSREHAPWALIDHGFRAVVSTSFGDIFRNNSLKNGLLPVTVDAEVHARLVQLLAGQPTFMLTIDLVSQEITLPDGATVKFPIDAFSKNCLLKGVDELDYILSFEAQIASFEAAQVIP